MQRLGTVPIYFETNDQRVIDYLQKNVAHHELSQNLSTTPKEKTKGGNGKIRQALIGVAVTPFLLAALWVFFAFGHAMGLS